MKPFKRTVSEFLLVLQLGAASFGLVHGGYQVWHDFHIGFHLQQLERIMTKVVSKFYR